MLAVHKDKELDTTNPKSERKATHAVNNLYRSKGEHQYKNRDLRIKENCGDIRR